MGELIAVRQPAYAMFPTGEYQHRVARAQTLMEERGVDALIVTAKENVVYFSGIRTIGWTSKHRPMGVIVPRERIKPVVMILPETLYEVAYNTSWIEDVRPWGGWRRKDAISDPILGMQHALRDLGVAEGKLGLELGYGMRVGMSQEDFALLKAGMPSAEFVDCGPIMWELRMIKSQHEIDALRTVNHATTVAFEKGFGSLRPGMTERELAGNISAELALQTNEIPGFLMVRSGPLKYGMVNVEAFEKKIVPGELVVVDVGAHFNYYWSDFMRMASIGEPSPDQRRLFDAELASQQAGVDTIRPGVKLHEIFDACYDTLIDKGVAEHVPGLERVGHGLGLDPHEPPSIARGAQTVAQPGMVLTVEPIFWDQPDHSIGNFALEDVVLVTETGQEVLSTFPKDLYIV